MTYKLKNKFKYKSKTKNLKYKSKTNNGVQQIVKINLDRTTNRRRKPQQRRQILNNVRPTQMSLNQGYTQPTTFNDTITAHKLGLLELSALETKNNIQDMTTKGQLFKNAGAIEGEKYSNAIERLTRQYEAIEEDYNDTKQKAGMMFGKIGENLEVLRGRTEQREFSTPQPERVKTLYPPPAKEDDEEKPAESSGGRKEESGEEKPAESSGGREYVPEPEKERETEEEEPKPPKHEIYYSEKSMYSNLGKILGVSLMSELKKHATDEGMTTKEFVSKMYKDNPDIGFTDNTAERKKIVKEYVQSITGTKKRTGKK